MIRNSLLTFQRNPSSAKHSEKFLDFDFTIIFCR